MSVNESQHYQTQQIMTASPATLVFLLFDKAISCLREAIRAIESGEVEARWKANGRAMEIIEHLQMTLDMEAGGEIASNLDGIYSVLLRELPKVDLKNDAGRAQWAIGLLEPLRDSWKEISMQGEQASRMAAEAAAAQGAGRSAQGAASAATPEPARKSPGEATTPPAPGGIKISA